ncbi:extracellular serine/threonine protein CG31145-like [Physella acuta]|uniref:extracellular serine/threonine protein CG31145-like n=1 Tax=Physella acuta TaxID=109671 RepID=UPI0027DE8AAF|nr:extracellular serine/threonine protein CG31145-like [Physella acuta]
MFYRGINQNYLYNPDSGDDLKNLLKELSFKPVAHSVEYKMGSQLKLLLTFTDGGQGLFKPMRFSRQLESSSESFFFEDIERHTAEIAAFHVDRVLGLHRSPPVAGRWLNVTSDVLKAGDSDVSRRVFQSPEGNMCFSGTCQRFCQGQFAACGRPVLLEGSVSAFLPYNTASRRKREKHPFRRSYVKHVKWEMKEEFCEADLKTREVYKGGRKLLDLMDMAIFDFIIGNLDRHHYERFEEFGEKGFVLYYDHGRGFAQWQHDCAACKTPIKQCCLIRLTTLAKLVKLYQGPDSLSHVMRTSMRSDPLSPILGETHLDALDRRVGVLLRLVAGCVERAGNFHTVIVDDRHR